MSFINIEVEGKEYTLVDEFDDCGKDKIYCFAGDEDDIFCIKKNEKYLPIKDEKLIKEVKEKHNLMPLDIIYDAKTVIDKIESKEKVKSKTENKQLLDSASKEKFVNEVIEVLKNNVPNFNEKSSRKRLKDVNIYVIEEMPEETTRAFYQFSDNSMYFKKDDIEGDSVKNKRTRLHETIHALYGSDLLKKIASDSKGYNKIAFEKFNPNRGLLEGATEELVESIYADKKDRITQLEFYEVANLSDECSYTSLVSIIRQIKYITGKDTTEFLFDGKNDILKELAEKCGKDETRYIRYESNLISRGRSEYDKDGKGLDLIQDYLLHSFDKEVDQVTNIQEAEQFMDRLKNFEKLRIDKVLDQSFEFYYQEKLSKLLEIIGKDYSLSVQDMMNFENKYMYKNWITELYEDNKEIRSQIQDTNFSNVMRSFVQGKFKSFEQIPKDFFKDVKVLRKMIRDNEYYVIIKNGKKVNVKKQDIKTCTAIVDQTENITEIIKEPYDGFEEIPLTKEVTDKILEDAKAEFERLEKWRETQKNTEDIDFEEKQTNVNENKNEPIQMNNIFDKIKVKTALLLNKSDALMKIPFLKNFIKKTLNVLPAKSRIEEKPIAGMETKRKEFLNEISGNGEYKNLPQIDLKDKENQNEEQKENTEENVVEDGERI